MGESDEDDDEAVRETEEDLGLLREMALQARELSDWEKRNAAALAEAERERVEYLAAEAERRKVTYSASSPVSDTPEAVMRAIGRALGRCEDAQEEVLYHGKFANGLDERKVALAMMPA